jgi:hypothetical protein
MYYDTGWVIPSGDDWHRFTCLATSTDGVHWVKPNLGPHFGYISGLLMRKR